MNADNQPVGDAFNVSPDDVNAGQPQIAIGQDGKGIVAFLAEHTGYEVTAVGLACAKGSN